MEIKEHPELFPAEIISGYKLKEIRFSKKIGIKTRRILIAGVSYTVRPSFVMPYMSGFEKMLKNRCFYVSLQFRFGL